MSSHLLARKGWDGWKGGRKEEEGRRAARSKSLLTGGTLRVKASEDPYKSFGRRGGLIDEQSSISSFKRKGRRAEAPLRRQRRVERVRGG